MRNTAYGSQAVFLVDYNTTTNNIILFDTTGKQLLTAMNRTRSSSTLRRAGVKVVAPAFNALCSTVRAIGSYRRCSRKICRSLGFDLISWSFERVDLRRGAAGAGSYYDFDPTGAAIKKDSDMYKALDVLAKDVKLIGMFSDWPATVSYYASCMGLD